MSKRKPLNPELYSERHSAIKVLVCILRDVMGVRFEDAMTDFVYCWKHLERYDD